MKTYPYQVWQYAPEIVVGFLRESRCVKQNPCPIRTCDNSPAIHRWEWMHQEPQSPIGTTEILVFLRKLVVTNRDTSTHDRN